MEPLTIVASREPRLKDVLPAALASLGFSDFISPLEIPRCDHVIVLLVDGLGEQLLVRNAPAAPILTSAKSVALQTEFPSTTPVALASLGTGLPPGSHGFVGASFWLPQEDVLLAPLKWGSDPHPLAIYPEPTVFELASQNGVDVATIAKARYQNSGLTRSVLRGSRYIASDSDLALQVRDRIQHASTPALTYVYLPELDRIGHIHGPETVPWIMELSRIDTLIGTMVDELDGGSRLVVTADHGMVHCPPDLSFDFDRIPNLSEGIRVIAGDPRARHIYTRRGASSAEILEAIERWRATLGSAFAILARDEILAKGLFSVDQSEVADRIGDFMAISISQSIIKSGIDPLASSLLGQHGALDSDEMAIPFRVFSAE